MSDADDIPTANVAAIGHVHGLGAPVGDKPMACPCGRSHIVVECPACGRMHTHGGDKRDVGTHRVAHCQEIRGYYLGEKP